MALCVSMPALDGRAAVRGGRGQEVDDGALAFGRHDGSPFRVRNLTRATCNRRHHPRFDFRDTKRRLDGGIRVQGDGVDASLDQPGRKVRVVGWRLTANTDRLAGTLCRVDGMIDHPAHGSVALVEEARHRLGNAVEPQRQLCQIVRPDREAVEDARILGEEISLESA